MVTGDRKSGTVSFGTVRGSLALVAALGTAFFAGAVVLFSSADSRLEMRTAELLETRCSRVIPIPLFVYLFNYTGAILLAGAAAAFGVLVLMLGRRRFRCRAAAIAATAIVLVITLGYSFLVLAAIVAPSSDEPTSSSYRPCPSVP